jgi:ferric-dicitrate binding protein FerR (iron transport regulator)
MDIDCRTVKGCFLDLEEGGLAPRNADALRAHLAACAACRQAWDQWQADDHALRGALRPVPVPRDLVAPVIARVGHAARVPVSFTRRPIVRWALAAAAVVLVAVGATLWLRHRYERVGHVASIQGRPMAQHKGAGKASLVEIGSPIYDGDLLLAGKDCKMAVEMDDGSVLDVDPSTEAQLCGRTSGEVCAHHFRHVCLRGGTVEFDVHSTRRFQGVGTPLGSVIVHGTRFRVTYVPGKRTVLEVIRGVVVFSAPKGEVRAEQGTVWEIDGEGGLPVQIAEPPSE